MCCTYTWEEKATKLHYGLLRLGKRDQSWEERTNTTTLQTIVNTVTKKKHRKRKRTLENTKAKKIVNTNAKKRAKVIYIVKMHAVAT